MNQRIRPALEGVPETMLYTLRDRVYEATRRGGRLHDPDAVRIYHQLDVDFRRFGPPTGAFGLRAAGFDEIARAFVATTGDPVVISLGEGLETQRYRVDGDRLWVSVDLPVAMDVRERFMAPDDAHWHVRDSATAPGLFDGLPAGRPTLVLAQGLLMYLPPHEVKALVVRLAERRPGARLAFDVLPRWLTSVSQVGLPLSTRYRLPRMPFGLDRGEAARVLSSWVPGATTHEHPLPFAWSVPRLLYGAARRLPLLAPRVPSIVVVDLPRR
ncbi:MAG: class I SAM-dependent methyltransferase [Myxococcota bacterium]